MIRKRLALLVLRQTHQLFIFVSLIIFLVPTLSATPYLTGDNDQCFLKTVNEVRCVTALIIFTWLFPKYSGAAVLLALALRRRFTR